MGLLTSGVLRLRGDPRLLRLPPYLALICMIGGIVWMLMLPLDEYSRRTYVSENALLPGQVHTYFHGSEQNIFRGYRHEVAKVLEPKSIDDDNGQPTGTYLVATEEHRNNIIESIFRNAGIKTARQKYSYTTGGMQYAGENVYAIVHGPRADGTESIVLAAPVRNIEDKLNVNGVALLLTLARYFSRWSLWSKDIILLITPDTMAGPQAWVDAYHSMHDPAHIADLDLKSGHIQGVVAIDYPFDHRFDSMHVAYDGINGQLPNLDLINTAVAISSGQMGIGTTIQLQHQYTRPEDQSKYMVRLQTLFRGMGSQALGHSTGVHSVFMPYHIDAITLTAVGNGWQDEMAFGRVVESLTRSLNNLLEKMHQSFFFYLLLQNSRFVSIGTYLPSAMAIGAGFTLVAIWRWISGGYKVAGHSTSKKDTKEEDAASTSTKRDVHATPEKNETNKSAWKESERPLVLPISILAGIHLASVFIIFLPSTIPTTSALHIFGSRCSALLSLTLGVFALLTQRSTTPTSLAQLHNVLSSLSLLILGLEVTVLATLNFSLSMFLGLVCAPMAFVKYSPASLSTSPSPSPHSPESTPPPTSSLARTLPHIIRSTLSLLSLLILSPPILIFLVATIDIYYVSPFRAPIGILGRVREYLETQAFAYGVSRSWGSLVGVWAIWSPAWVVGVVGVLGSL